MKRAASTPPPMHGNEMRYNPATGRWVIYALSRRQRPRELIGSREGARTEPAYDELCPFCPGHEQDLPPILLEYGCGDSHRQIRVVRNKYPALTPEGDLKRVCQGMYMRMEGYGHHEVLIESPEHNRQIPVMTPEEVELIIEAYHRRYLKLIGVQKNLLVVIFRNYGRRAGASLMHPHSQIISTGVVPGHVREMEYRAQGYFDQWGSACTDMSRKSSGRRTRHPCKLVFVSLSRAHGLDMDHAPGAQGAFRRYSAEEKTDLASRTHAGGQERLNDRTIMWVHRRSTVDEPGALGSPDRPKLTTQQLRDDRKHQHQPARR